MTEEEGRERERERERERGHIMVKGCSLWRRTVQYLALEGKGETAVSVVVAFIGSDVVMGMAAALLAAKFEPRVIY